MSTSPSADNSNTEGLSLPALDLTSESLEYIVIHVFLPIELPKFSDYTIENGLSLARAVCTAAHAYTAHLSGPSQSQWHHITRMLDNLQAFIQSEPLDRDHFISQLRAMRTGDVLAFLIRPHDSAVILTKRESCTLLESFEVPPPEDAVREAAGPLICSYPTSTVEVVNEMFEGGDFQFELAELLCHRPNAVDPDYPSLYSPHPKYVAVLLSHLLQGVGHSIDVPCITKRVRDDVIGNDITRWRRSSLWLLTRVAVEVSLGRSPLGPVSYKSFMLFFVCVIGRATNIANFSTEQLHLIECKILRRLGKLRSSTSIPNWLSQVALETCTGLRKILNARWMRLSTRARDPFRSPSHDELTRDTKLSLTHSDEYIRSALANCSHRSVDTPFHPNHHRRGTIGDFLSSDGSFFTEAYDTDPDVTLYDIERSVEQEIDDWSASVTNVEKACIQLEILMDKYMHEHHRTYGGPESASIMLLTGVELFVVIDRLVIEEIPMLAHYSPEIPLPLLERLLLRKKTHLHHLSRSYQYLSLRHSQARAGWSVLSNEFTEDSFAVRYYDGSLHHQRLMARIDEDAVVGGLLRSPLPSQPLDAKIVVFELQCPALIRVWRSAVARILHYAYYVPNVPKGGDFELLAHNYPLKPYFIQDAPGLFQVCFAYFYPEYFGPKYSATLCYVIQHLDSPCYHYTVEPGRCGLFWFYPSSLQFDGSWVQDLGFTSHTPNDILAAQACCPADLSLDEFFTSRQLRSGGSVQWINILRGLHSRSLNLHRRDVHFLLSAVVSQVGPLDSNTGTWLWHQDLHEPSFCHALLDELRNTFVEVGIGYIDDTIMNTISLLLARVLASSPGEDVSERAIALIRMVRRKTFSWVQELSYNLAKEPMEQERINFLAQMVATCRSTFDFDSATPSKLFCSAEDVDAAVSGALFIRVLRGRFTGSGSPDMDVVCRETFLSRDHRLALTLDGDLSLKNAILVDPSNYGTDLAIRRVFHSYKPGPNKWEQLQHPNSRWFTCQSKETVDGLSQTVHLNPLDGTLQMGCQQLGGLPPAITHDERYRQIFRDQGFFVVPSSLPTMDFTTLTTSKSKVHFSLKGDVIVIRVQHAYSKDVLELIPWITLEKDLPPALIHGHVHWLNMSSRTIEIRPLECIWEESWENWRIDCASGQYHAYRHDRTLVDFHSPTWIMVSTYFDRFPPPNEQEESEFLITTFPAESHQPTSVRQLSVALPRYGLAFFVNSRGELESFDFKDMVYDEDKYVGALFGLESILVLRQKAHLPDGLIPRRILVSDDYLTPQELPSYYAYNVDTELGCLVGNPGGLYSTPYLAYLHQQTNNGTPDPLSGRTGAQAAFCLMQSAECWSVSKPRFPLSIYTRYPQINALRQKMKERCYWMRRGWDGIPDQPRTAQRAAYLFSWCTPTGLTSLQAHKHWHDGDGCSAIPGLFSSKQKQWSITLEQLLFERSAPELPHRRTLLCCNPCNTSSDDTSELNKLFSYLPINKSCSFFQQEYIALLEKSAQCVHEASRAAHRLTAKDWMDELQKYYMECRAKYFNALSALEQTLGPTNDPYEQALRHCGLWPPTTADILLRYLASTSPIKLSGHWKKCLMSLAILLLDLQRARRMVRFALDGLDEELSKELENVGCDGWDPEEFPDWLLIQVQGNFLIRRTQAEVAKEMISPQSGKSTVMQLNMGEGKSSVIIPIVAAALADGKRLVRVIVPKALIAQMFGLLVARLGGLANRPIYHLPFTRSLEHDEHGDVVSLEIYDLHGLMSQCMAERGVLLVQPEHVMSQKLMAVDQLLHNPRPTANATSKPQASIHRYITAAVLRTQLSEHSFLGDIFRSLRGYYGQSSCNVDYSDDSSRLSLQHQQWIHSNVRDILDEADEILHPRVQLMYTIGLPQHMDGYPDRWTITQQVLQLVKECARTLSRNHPDSVAYKPGPPGSFPHIRIMSQTPDAGRHLISLVVEDVMAGRLPGTHIRDIPDPELHRAIRSFISDRDVLQVPDTVKRVEVYAKYSGGSCLWSGLLLLRGLLASNILLFALTERRWRVDYGLISQSPYPDCSQTTTTLAVPFRAKDLPALDTQFGHPDITIILTCLSYYYGGLSEKQLRAAFEILLSEDDPTIEYALWVDDYANESIPESLRTLGEVNLRSSEQWDKVMFPLFSRNQAAIDFYLSRVVFPKEAKEYPWKLCASSWDLAEKRAELTTGFSGTNDGQWLFPMSIAQRDPEHQRATNARALACLLRSENNFYCVATEESGSRLTASQLLKIIAAQQPEIRTLVDVGAQVLDLSNEGVAKAWLDIVNNAAGAIYFNGMDELTVLVRNGSRMPMQSSPLSQQLDRCVVYLDHAHTRGTDIKLPVGSRAAVTLGPKLTKDTLVQGCMRMRKLGRGHSVMFFAPPEVDRSIRIITGKKDRDAMLTTADILCWAIHETWADIQRWAPSWAQQGINHKARYESLSRFGNTNERTSRQLSDAWLQKEHKSLENLYAPGDSGNTALLSQDPGIRQRCKDLGVLSLPTAQMDEEQEREVSREKERERETEIPPEAGPAEHSLHDDVVAFVRTGVFPPLYSGSAFRPIFTTLENSSAVSADADVWSPLILATADFCSTIKRGSTRGTIDQYLRPVEWVLSSKTDHDPVLVLISPFEADRLMSDIRDSEYVHLHVYAPRTSWRTKPSDDLRLYSIPPLPSDWTPPWALIDQLNIFAGQLYLRDYDSYLRLCHFLGVPSKESPDNGALVPGRNVFQLPGSFEENEITFTSSPLPFVMALLAIRTRGKPFAHTHMGKILYGIQLTPKDFEDPQSAAPGQTNTGGDEDAFYDPTVDTTYPPYSDVDCGPYDDSGPSMIVPSAKQRLEVFGVSG